MKVAVIVPDRVGICNYLYADFVRFSLKDQEVGYISPHQG